MKKALIIIGKSFGMIIAIPFAILIGILIGVVRFLFAIVELVDDVIVSIWS